jgi:hypothetical protein
MRVGEEWDACIAQQGVQYIGGEDPPRAGGQGERRPGEAATLGAAPPLTLTLMGCGSPLGLGGGGGDWGRQQPAARVAPPQTLMGCSPAVVAAQSYTNSPILYNSLTIISRENGRNCAFHNSIIQTAFKVQFQQFYLPTKAT